MTDANDTRPLFRDTTARPEARARDLLVRLSLDEKLAQLAGTWGRPLLTANRLDPDKARAVIGAGIGHVGRLAEFDPPADVARLAREIQTFLVEHTRFGIPAIFHEEALAGAMVRDAVQFPMPIALAATFDPDLVERIGAVVQRQMRALGVHQVLAPVLDVARDHRWGRCEETYGEDPCLIGALGAAFVRGVQGPDRACAATLKHFAGYAASAAGLNWGPAALGWRELLDVHVAPFCTALDAGARSVMNAYQEIDGVPAGAHRGLLTDLLRGTLGFDGTVVTDYYTLPSFADYHNVAADLVEAARLGLRAGLDVELPAARVYGAPLRAALERGQLDVADVDRAVYRVLLQKFAQGLFERPFGDPATPFGLADDESLAREAAVRSIVLLRNEGSLLPLRGSRRLAVVGPHADSMRLLLGDYHFPAHHDFEHGPIREQADDAREPPTAGVDTSAAPTPGSGFANATSPILLDGLRATAGLDLYELLPRGRTILEALRDGGESCALEYARGCRSMDAESGGVEAAVACARRADVAIVCVGERSGLARRSTSGEASDRATLGLYGPQEELVRAVAATGTPIVLVVVSGRPLALARVIDSVAAVLYAWTPGPLGGLALADVIFGRRSPCGRLPVSLLRDQGQLPYTYAHKPSGGRSQFWGDYADLSSLPLYPFGFGLSYTRFELADGAVEAAVVPTDGTLRASITVRNAGECDASDVVQAYMRDLAGSVTRPVLEMKAFARVDLPAGASRRVHFEIPAEQCAFTGSDDEYAIEPGAMQLLIGRSSRELAFVADWALAGPRRPVRRVGRRPWSARIGDV